MAAAGQSSITVAVRVRPFTIREAAQLHRNDDSTLFLGDGSLASAPAPKLHQRGLRNVIKVVDDRCLVFDPPEDNPVQKFSRSVVPTSKRVKDQVFAFDRVFDENTTQTDVYEGTTKNLLDSVLDGYNATVFAYGATGCGKTHTITGTAQHPGIIFLTMQELFEKIDERSQDKTTELSLSYLEIYNETIRDLLVPGGSKQGLTLREDSNQAVMVAGLTSHRPRDVQEVMDMIVQGNEYRTVSPTEANATSSRSHAVLQVNVAQRDRNADVSEPHTMATLSIIDLAGSERASVTKNRGERLAEGANINKSLLALGSCINALCDRRQRAHVPYRNSKLTRLLKFSLGGNCKTVMIVCISPSSAHFDETQNTLRYANRAKNIQTKVTRNVFNVNRHVKDFLVKIDEQMALINELKAQQKDAENIAFAKFRKQCDKRDCVVREGVQRLRAAYDHAAGERQERVVVMKKLRAFERRISLLSGWIAAFDAVCDRRSSSSDEDVGGMPKSLAAIRKTAKEILVELEISRQHLHQKLDKASWERAIDTALTHSLKQLEGVEGVESAGEAASGLERESELLKTRFAREAYHEVLESERGSDAAVVQMLLTAQLDMLASLTDLMAMDEERAVAQARKRLGHLLQMGHDAAAQVVKPDVNSAPLPVIDAFPPTRKGTPKRKKTASYAYARPAMPHFDKEPGSPTNKSSPTKSSPTKSLSPRRRKVLGGASHLRKGVCFSPVRRAKGRGVRWRDDEMENGTLADYDGTPRRWDESPVKKRASLMSPMRMAAGATEDDDDDEERQQQQDQHQQQQQQNQQQHQLAADEGAHDSSPSALAAPGGAAVAKTGRFQAGFLSKGLRCASGSPQRQSPLKLNLRPAASSPDLAAWPLRTLSVDGAGNSALPGQATRCGVDDGGRVGGNDDNNHVKALGQQLRGVNDENKPPLGPHDKALSGGKVGATNDENRPPSLGQHGKALLGQDTGAPNAENKSPPLLRMPQRSQQTPSPQQGAQAGRGGRRIGSPDTSSDCEGIDARKVRSAMMQQMGKGQAGRRTSGIALAMAARRAPSSSSGVSRLRRVSPPPMPCASALASSSPIEHGGGLTAGQARRMKLGGSVRLAESPREEVRRVTVGTAARRAVAWR